MNFDYIQNQDNQDSSNDLAHLAIDLPEVIWAPINSY